MAALLLACGTLLRGTPPVEEASGIVRRSIEAGNRNAERLGSWVSESRVDERLFDADGNLKSEETKTFDQIDLRGVIVRKLIAKDGKPLNAADQKKEDQRVELLAEARRNETPSQREKRISEAERKKEKQRAFNQEIIAAFHFNVLGEEVLAGRKAWLLEASPRPGYKPVDMRAGIFPHVRGKIWIDQKELLWAKAEADAFEPISVGFSLIAKLDEGAHLYFEQTRMDDGIWLPARNGIRAKARIAVVKRIAIDQMTTYRNFRRAPAGAAVDATQPK